MRRAVILILLAWGHALQGQTIKGKLFGQAEAGREILPGGTVRWLGTGIGAIANENGVFELPPEGISDHRIIASTIGYITDTVDVTGKTYVSITLRKDPRQLSEVTVRDKGNANIPGI